MSSFLLSEYCFDQFCDLVGTEKEIFVLLKNAAEIYLANDSDTVLERSSLLIDATNGIILEVGTTAAISHRLNNTQKSSSFSLIEIDLNFESSIIPGLVGMHEHLFYPGKGGTLLYSIQTSSSPLLYLARGVTTARTTGNPTLLFFLFSRDFFSLCITHPPSPWKKLLIVIHRINASIR